ncbi:hypothetical protein M427DRAFT_138260 [Gonapodya prolifera JEL478]|uniref:Uncharacterized protein n=1 Tax=Gonapodya prolifera (strain JEL478) TaxID=1344416 RepID=A0A139A3U0_GONPJ|nr:hypothetical protein M427DRAFT_138260 [Gonapodya prolifera JEL478]|eukprot:KXS11486.1 hypothetical protein M427DRAFT_138260 [Gonapodya prolifera JEL478]
MGANSTTNTTAPAPAGPTAGRATLTGFWLNLRLNEAVYWIWGACSVVVWISVAVDFVAAAQEKKFVKAITGKGNNVRKLEVALPTA